MARTSAPTAKMLAQEGDAQDWLIQWPGSLTKQGKAYLARTLRGEVIFILAAATRRTAQRGVQARIRPQIEAAIAAAR